MNKPTAVGTREMQWSLEGNPSQTLQVSLHFTKDLKYHWAWSLMSIIPAPGG